MPGNPLVIVAIDVDPCGGFLLRLTNGFQFEAFPDMLGRSDDRSEQWRLLRPGDESPHVVAVAMGTGTEIEQ